MSPIEWLHERYIRRRRVSVLASRVAALLPNGGRVLDIGCGDGQISEEIMRLQPKLVITGIDVLVRPDARIPVTTFDGRHLPYQNRSFDAVLLIDVLHHSADPFALLREAGRVGRGTILVKDHDASGWMAAATLRWMDRVGNARFEVALPHNYLEWRQWTRTFEALGYRVTALVRRLDIYPIPLRWVFDRSLHFIAVLRPSAS